MELVAVDNTKYQFKGVIAEIENDTVYINLDSKVARNLVKRDIEDKLFKRLIVNRVIYNISFRVALNRKEVVYYE